MEYQLISLGNQKHQKTSASIHLTLPPPFFYIVLICEVIILVDFSIIYIWSF